MKENKKRPLSEEELEQVAGGAFPETRDGVSGWKCSYCPEFFSTFEEAEKHQETCPVKISALNYLNSLNSNDSNTSSGGGGRQGLLKPIIL